MSARVPISRAYWNLRAEQVMDNFFDRETITARNQPNVVPVDADVHEPTTKPTEPNERHSRSTGLLLINGVEPLGSDQALAQMGPIPQLTGVVKGPGGSSSAIFQLGQGSVSAGIGEAIGSSGWVLSEVTESGAAISRNGQRQTLSVGGLF